MRILFLSKRRPMGRDLYEFPYGRFYYLPKLLAEQGHQVCLHLASYRGDAAFSYERDGLRWVSSGMRTLGPLGYLWHSAELARKLRPDWIVGFSDTYYGMLAVTLAQRYGARSLIDAYDNYESYLPWAGWLHRCWHNSLKKADVVTAAGPGLAELLGHERSRPAVVVPMAADPLGFAPLDRELCRTELGLPTGIPLIGYCGSLYPNRGLEVLFRAFKNVRMECPEAQLLLSGRHHPRVHLPPEAHYLGYVADEKIPKVLNSLNVLAVINKDSAFGQHSHPVKLYEAMACGLPVAATATLATRWILREHEEQLFPPGDSRSLAKCTLANLDAERVDYGITASWQDAALQLEKVMLDFQR